MNKNTLTSARPHPITAALLLCLTSLAFAFVSGLSSVIDFSSGNARSRLEEEILKASYGQAGELSAETLINIGIATAIGLAILFTILNIAITLIISYLILKGRKAVRILLIVFSAFAAISLVISGFSWISSGSCVILLATAALVWLPSSAAYFQAHAEARTQAASAALPETV